MFHRSRDALLGRVSSYDHEAKQIRPATKGGEAPKGACQPFAARHLQTLPFVDAQARLRAIFGGALAFRRFAAALARANASAIGSAPVPAFPETRPAGRYPLHLSRVYRAPRRPVAMPVERWPRAARERSAYLSAR
jgi:hypothetical protein